MSLKQRVKKFAKNTLYSAIALAALSLPGCRPTYINFGNIPEEPSKTQSLEEKMQNQSPDLSEIDSSQVTYDPKYRGYRVVGDFQIKGLRIGEYSIEDENYLFFDGKEHEGVDLPYISIGAKLVLGVPTKAFGSTVELLPGNAYIDIDDSNFVMVQALGGKRAGAIWIERKDWEKKILRITCSSGYNIFNGERAVKYNENVRTNNKGPGILNNNPIDVS